MARRRAGNRRRDATCRHGDPPYGAGPGVSTAAHADESADPALFRIVQRRRADRRLTPNPRRRLIRIVQTRFLARETARVMGRVGASEPSNNLLLGSAAAVTAAIARWETASEGAVGEGRQIV